MGYHWKKKHNKNKGVRFLEPASTYIPSLGAVNSPRRATVWPGSEPMTADVATLAGEWRLWHSMTIGETPPWPEGVPGRQ